MLTGWPVVAHGKQRRYIAAGVGQSAVTALSVATNGGRVAPNDLRVMAPSAEAVKSEWDIVRAVWAWVVVDLHVVHAVSDHDRDLLCSETGSDILAVVAISLGTGSVLAQRFSSR